MAHISEQSVVQQNIFFKTHLSQNGIKASNIIRKKNYFKIVYNSVYNDSFTEVFSFGWRHVNCKENSNGPKTTLHNYKRH